MKLYTDASLNKGAGVFDHIMRNVAPHVSYHRDLPTDVAIGLLAAAVKSGLPEDHIDVVIEEQFDRETGAFLHHIKQMYKGDSERLHLWVKERDRLRLHRTIRYRSKPDWHMPSVS